VKDSDDPAAFAAYLKRFPDGVFSDLAQLRIQALTAVAAEVQGAPMEMAALPPTDTSAADALPEEGATDEAAAPVPPPAPNPEDIRLVQQRLAALGYAVGGADGQLGPKTRAAIRTFQARAGLRANGEVSPDLLAALTSESAPFAPATEAKPEREPAASAAVAPVLPATQAGGQPEAAQNDALFWVSIQTSKDPADFEDYLKRFPDGAFASLAARRLALLTAPTDEQQPTSDDHSDDEKASVEAASTTAEDFCLSQRDWMELTYGERTAPDTNFAVPAYMRYVRQSGCQPRGPFQ
jgi:peptidoglycan hydrolase-like protein with peptidoglycan-binding domain